jgi:hypothetical protein
MRRATRIVASALGITAGIAGLEHGYFEVLQGSTQPAGLMIVSIGPPCVPEQSWNACEPAMTIVPNFLVTGILALILGLVILVWSAAFVQRRHGGVVLMLLSVALLLFGGGIFPPLIGLVGGAAGTRINSPLPEKAPGATARFTARLWPWPLVIFLVWTLGQLPVGYLFNDLLQRIMWFGLILILTMLPLSVYTAYAHDVVGQRPPQNAEEGALP